MGMRNCEGNLQNPSNEFAKKKILDLISLKDNNKIENENAFVSNVFCRHKRADILLIKFKTNFNFPYDPL